MTIKINGNRLVTALYAKPMALYQYNPPMSCHPPGALTGLVFGQILQIFQLCLRDENINSELSAFHHSLLDHGYKASNSYPFLSKGSTMPTITFPSPKLNERKQRKLGRAVQTREYFPISLFTHKTHPQVSSNVSGET